MPKKALTTKSIEALKTAEGGPDGLVRHQCTRVRLPRVLPWPEDVLRYEA